MTYRVLVTGSRAWTDHDLVRDALTQARWDASGPMIVVHGACPTGADAIADWWARSLGRNPGLGITVERHPAQHHPSQDFGPWPGAGPRRNTYMVSLGASVCLAFTMPCTTLRCPHPRPHDSHGTDHCARAAERAGIPTVRYRP